MRRRLQAVPPKSLSLSAAFHFRFVIVTEAISDEVCASVAAKALQICVQRSSWESLQRTCPFPRQFHPGPRRRRRRPSRPFLTPAHTCAWCACWHGLVGTGGGPSACFYLRPHDLQKRISQEFKKNRMVEDRMRPSRIKEECNMTDKKGRKQTR